MKIRLRADNGRDRESLIVPLVNLGFKVRSEAVEGEEYWHNYQYFLIIEGEGITNEEI